MAIRYKKIRTLAEDLLREHGCQSAPVDVYGLARSQGAVIYESPAQGTLSGYLAREASSGAIVIGVNSNQSERRQRFTVAHELGHLLLHKGFEMHVDHVGGMPMTYMVNLRGAQASEGTDEEEREANYFAAELLMPASFIKQDVAKIQGVDLLEAGDTTPVKILADLYKVSAEAFGFRLANLHLLG